jgi:hypothetical protein
MTHHINIKNTVQRKVLYFSIKRRHSTIRMYHMYHIKAYFLLQSSICRWTVLLILIWCVLLDGLHCTTLAGEPIFGRPRDHHQSFSTALVLYIIFSQLFTGQPLKRIFPVMQVISYYFSTLSSFSISLFSTVKNKGRI